MDLAERTKLHTLIISRGALVAFVLLAFLCSLALGAQFELFASIDPASGGRRTQRLEFEELTALSGIFSLLLAAAALLSRMSAIQERRARKVAETSALLDPLTGLANRRLFNHRLEEALARHRVDHAPCALLLVDLDRFKQVNDSFGHSAGDKLLVAVGERIRLVAPVDEDAARLGGDEFALILHGGAATPANASALAAELKRAISRPVPHAGRSLRSGASIGIAFATAGSSRAADLLEAADADMYRSKRLRKDPVAA